MARHRAPITKTWREWLSDLIKIERPATPEPSEFPTGPANIVEPDRVDLTPTRQVRLDYPDGSHLHAGWQYNGPAASGHEQYIVRLPATAQLVHGMVIRAARDVVLSVAVRDVPLQMRTHGGGVTDAL